MGRLINFLINLKAMPGRIEALARLPARITNLEKRIERLNGQGALAGDGGSAAPAVANGASQASPAAIDASGRAAPGATNTPSTAEVEAAKTAFNDYLASLLNRPLENQTYSCRCCGHDIDLSAREPLDATCFISGLNLRRYDCPHCSVVFGPVQLIECSPEELGRVYELLYGFLHEGDSRIGQEKAFYCANPGFSERILNYACGDWDKGLANLREIGWNVEGYEPFQTNSSPHIYARREDVPQTAYDVLFSHNYLEHVQDPIAFFTECQDYIRPGGRMAHSTPCYAYVFEQSPLHLPFCPARYRQCIGRKNRLYGERALRVRPRQRAHQHSFSVLRLRAERARGLIAAGAFRAFQDFHRAP